MKKYYQFAYSCETVSGQGYDGEGWSTGIGEFNSSIEKFIRKKTGSEVRTAKIECTGKTMSEREYNRQMYLLQHN